MEYNLLEDTELTYLVSSGDQQALAALYDRHSSRVFSLAMTILGDRADAEEVTQDVILSVWRNSGTFDPLKARFSTWITHITHNRAVDELRKRRRRSQETPLENEMLEQLESQDAPSLETGAEFYRIQGALRDLPHQYQRVIYLSYFQGYTQKEISEMLGQPLGTVKTHMRSALKRLRESIGVPAEELL